MAGPSKKHRNDPGSESPPPKKAKKDSPTKSGSFKGDGVDICFWLNEKKCLKITSYGSKKDATRIDIREYYEKDGEKLPGKKGISLPLEVFRVMVGYLPQIEIELKKRGETLSRPDYCKAEPTGLEQQADGAADVEGDDDNNQDEEVGRNVSRSKNGEKKNFEETSDEED